MLETQAASNFTVETGVKMQIADRSEALVSIYHILEDSSQKAVRVLK
jgi:hypothetical protein